ncbi:MAG: four helix bundle protein [Patescibacteria group bacterium]|nr:four helix bundle protein [Patescibacteria group bacterium]
MENNNKEFDLCKRTINFSKSVIDFIKSIPENIITKPIIGQLIRSTTSIGANYHEATECDSKKDFINKIAITKKETKETKYWLEIISHSYPKCKEEARNLWKEAHELNLIFSKSITTSKEKKLDN